MTDLKRVRWTNFEMELIAQTAVLLRKLFKSNAEAIKKAGSFMPPDRQHKGEFYTRRPVRHAYAKADATPIMFFHVRMADIANVDGFLDEKKAKLFFAMAISAQKAAPGKFLKPAEDAAVVEEQHSKPSLEAPNFIQVSLNLNETALTGWIRELVRNEVQRVLAEQKPKPVIRMAPEPEPQQKILPNEEPESQQAEPKGIDKDALRKFAEKTGSRTVAVSGAYFVDKKPISKHNPEPTPTAHSESDKKRVFLVGLPMSSVSEGYKNILHNSTSNIEFFFDTDLHMIKEGDLVIFNSKWCKSLTVRSNAKNSGAYIVWVSSGWTELVQQTTSAIGNYHGRKYLKSHGKSRK